jgi:hypothetical protein
MPNGQSFNKEPSTYKELALQTNIRLDSLEKDVGEILSAVNGYMDKNNERVGCLEVGQEQRRTKLEGIEKDIEDLYEKHDKVDSKVNGWGGINSIVAFVAGLIGWFK